MDKRILMAMILVLSLVGTASATTWSVDGSGEADFTGIQEAINNASTGDTIIVHSGVYYENVVVDKSVTLKGIGYPIVDACGERSAITLNADGITLEGFNATNTGSQPGVGIKVTSNNNTISGNNICSNSYGIFLDESSNNNSITGNDVSNNNNDGVYLTYFSSNNLITGNNISNNDDGISLGYSSNNNIISGNTFVNDGLSVDGYSWQNTVEDNKVNGKPLVYLEDASDYKVTDAGQVILVNCTNITVENLDLSNTSVGIELWKTESSRIRNNKVSNNNRYGIYLKDYSNNNIITGNKACRNSDGICITYSGNNIISGNNVCNNDGVGIDFDYSSSSNNIYLNNFINNTDNVNSINVDSVASTNTWNLPSGITYTYNGTTYESYLGNYWDDYEGTDADGDGIGNTPYSIDSENDENDDYPLMMPFENYLT